MLGARARRTGKLRGGCECELREAIGELNFSSCLSSRDTTSRTRGDLVLTVFCIGAFLLVLSGKSVGRQSSRELLLVLWIVVSLVLDTETTVWVTEAPAALLLEAAWRLRGSSGPGLCCMVERRLPSLFRRSFRPGMQLPCCAKVTSPSSLVS